MTRQTLAIWLRRIFRYFDDKHEEVEPMTVNLLMWKWSDKFTGARRKRRPKFSCVVEDFLETEDSPVFSSIDMVEFETALEDEFGQNRDYWPFTLEIYKRCVLINIANQNRLEMIPRVAKIGAKFSMTASEF